MFRKVIALGMLLAVQGSCGGSTSSQTAAGPTPSGGPRRSANTLLLDEVQAEDRSLLTVYQAIQKYRPRFLKELGYTNENTSGASSVVLYVDDVKMAGFEQLNQLRMSDVEKVQYLTGAEGTMRFGMGHDHGVIMVTRRK